MSAKPSRDDASERSEASHANGARRRSGARESVQGSPRGEAPRTKDDFDLAALRAALDAQRRDRGLSWAEAARQINAVGPETPRHPIAVSTITGLGSKRLAEAAGVLQMLRWLGRSPESFVPRCPADVLRAAALPDAPADRVMRFDTRKLYDALDGERRRRGLTWDAVGKETGVGASHARGLAKGGRTAFPGVMRLTAWLGEPASRFVRLTPY